MMPVVGFMPVVWSGAWDLSGQIRCLLGFFFVVLLLHRSEPRKKKKATVSLNKAVVWYHLLMWNRGSGKLYLAGRGGEGMKRTRAAISTSLRWRRWLMLLAGVNHTVDVLAAVICGWKGGPSRRRFGVSSTSAMEALPGASRRSSASSRRQVVRPRRCQDGRRWRLVPGGEDPGLDCFLQFSLRVLCANVQDCVVFSFFPSGSCM